LPLIALLGFSLAAPCADAPAKLPPKLKPIPACPALVAAAKLNQIPIEGTDAASGTNGLRPGDSASVLVTFVQKKKQTQWLLYLEAATPDPAKPAAKPTRLVVHSSFGPPIKFESKPAPVKLQMLGPFGAAGWKKPPKSEVAQAQFSVNEDFLGLGLDQAAALLGRWSKTIDFNKPVTSKAMSAMDPTSAEQRTVCGTIPALMSYFNVVRHTEALSELFYKLVDLPSLWSMIRHGGVNMDLSFGHGDAPSLADPADWNPPAPASVYYFPWMLRLNEQPALKVTMVTASPRRPLLICGGVLGLLVERIGDEETYMTFRVVSAKGEVERRD
jgi:hypothetical protein